MPLFSLESQRPARDFDVIGFTLQSELTYTNILTMLDLAGLPLRRDRPRARRPAGDGGRPGAATRSRWRPSWTRS